MPTYRDDEHLGHKVPLVETDDIMKGAVTTDKISDGAVTTEKIADGAVTTEKLADNSVTGEKIQDHAITPQQLPEDFVVTERMIADQAIGTDKIADNAVTTPKIANQAVTTEKIADQNVTEEKLAPGAVTTEKLADGMIEQLQTITDAEPTPDSVKPLQSGGAASVLGHYIENPEFVRAVTDNEDKVLYGVQADGNFYFGAGCPQQVKDYIQKQIDTIMGVGDVTEKIDTINEMIAFFDQISHDENLKSLLDALDAKKVDKEEGKSLIDAEYAEGISYEDNPEFVNAVTDNNGRLLFALKKEDGKPFFPQNELYHVVSNPEWLAAWLDSEDRILMGIKTDGEIYGSNLNFTEIIGKISSVLSGVDFSIEDNPEWLQVELDSEGKVLSGTKSDGSHYIHNVESESIPTAFSEINDVENRMELTLDTEEKVVSYRDEEGVLHENAGIITLNAKAENLEVDNLEVKNLEVENLEVENMPSIKVSEVTDTIYCERPKFGRIDFVGILPTDTSDARTPTRLEMTFKINDIEQFKCNCTLAIQGHGTTTFSKKGYTLEPYNSEWEAVSIKFGDMIAIDSFHLKAYPLDSLHCRDMGAFDIYRDMMQKLDYPYSKINNIPFEFVDFNKNKLYTADAKYAPTGFPVVCYLNGEFLGLYTIKLKKSRQNYAMEKSVKSEIFLDAINYQGSMDHGFVHEGWEVKNPKMKNYEEGGEIPDQQVAASVNRLFNWLAQIDVNDSSSYADYQDYIVLPHWITFMVFEEMLYSIDIVNNNINLATWDANHWSIIPYDLDNILGLRGGGAILTEATNFVLNYGIFTKLTNIFEAEIRQYYTKLRRENFITPQNIVKYFINQCNSIPRDVYSKDNEKWGNNFTNGYPSIEQLFLFMKNRIEWLDSQWLNE